MIRCSLCKGETWAWIPSTHIKTQAWWCLSETRELKEQRQTHPGVYWQASVGDWWALTLVRETVPNHSVASHWARHLASASVLYTHVSAHACEYIYIQRKVNLQRKQRGKFIFQNDKNKIGTNNTQFWIKRLVWWKHAWFGKPGWLDRRTIRRMTSWDKKPKEDHGSVIFINTERRWLKAEPRETNFWPSGKSCKVLNL